MFLYLRDFYPGCCCLSPFLLQSPVTRESRGFRSQPLISPNAHPLLAVSGLLQAGLLLALPPSTSISRSPLTGQTEASMACDGQPGRGWRPGGVPDSDLLGPSERKRTVTTNTSLGNKLERNFLPEERRCLGGGGRAGSGAERISRGHGASLPAA